jgi:hypothetical protein
MTREPAATTGGTKGAGYYDTQALIVQHGLGG